MRQIKTVGDSCKKQVERIKNVKLKFTVNKGRNKYVSFYGAVENTYPNIFTVRSEYEGELKTFSYSDILTGNIMICPPENPLP